MNKACWSYVSIPFLYILKTFKNCTLLSDQNEVVVGYKYRYRYLGYNYSFITLREHFLYLDTMEIFLRCMLHKEKVSSSSFSLSNTANAPFLCDFLLQLVFWCTGVEFRLTVYINKSKFTVICINSSVYLTSSTN